MSTHINHAEGQYVVCGGADQYWIGTNAKTLSGAKASASKTYQATIGGKIEVAQVRGEQYVRCAVKYGYSKWQGA